MSPSKTLSGLLLAAALFQPGASVPQDPAADRDKLAKQDLFGRADSGEGTMIERLQGAWQLTHMAVDNRPADQLSGRGMMLISGTYMAFMLDGSRADTDRGVERIWQGSYEAFIGEFELLPINLLSCRTLIGSFFDEEWRETLRLARGLKREFRLRFEHEALILEWSRGNSLTFVRRPDKRGKLTDFFGRATDVDATADIDMFGRRKPPKPDEDDKQDDE